MELKKKAELFRVLGDTKRLELLHLLMKGTLCPGALSRATKITRSAVSQHMRVLKAAGLVVGEKRGLFIHYNLDLKNISALEKKLGVRLGLAEKASSGARPVCHAKKGLIKNARECLR